MTTETSWIDGKCGYTRIRVKKWKAGFSIKCWKGQKTMVGRPFNEDFLKKDLLYWCDNCKETQK